VNTQDRPAVITDDHLRARAIATIPFWKVVGGADKLPHSGLWRRPPVSRGEKPKNGLHAANVQPPQRLPLPLFAKSAFRGVVESNSYRALPLSAGKGTAFKSRRPDQLKSIAYE
jgi:hypothetical protein